MDNLSTTHVISIIAPIFLLQLLLTVIALIVLIKTKRTRGPKWLWAIIIVFGNLLGSVLFFLIGRRSV